MSTTRLRCAAIVGALMATAMVPTAAEAKKTISISGSTTVAPLAEALARKYVKVVKHKVGFRLLQGGSDVGVSDVAGGRVSIGMSSRIPKSSDPGGLVFNQIAKDALCIATHPSNPVANLNTGQVQDIWKAAPASLQWSSVPGSPKGASPINAYVRTAASGTQDAFDKIFMTPFVPHPNLPARASNGLVQNAVQSDPNGIGYVSLDFTAGLNVPSYNGVACNLRNAKAGQYGGTRPLYFVTKGKPKGAVKKFIKWTRKKKAASKVISNGWVPLR